MSPSISGVMLLSALAAFLHADVQVAYVSVEPARQLAYRLDIAGLQYYEVFVALRGTPIASGSVFVVDAGADGVLSAVPGAKDVDIAEEDTRATRFDGDLAAQRLSVSEYDAELAGADAAYARLLKVLLAAIYDSRSVSRWPRTIS